MDRQMIHKSRVIAEFVNDNGEVVKGKDLAEHKDEVIAFRTTDIGIACFIETVVDGAICSEAIPVQGDSHRFLFVINGDPQKMFEAFHRLFSGQAMKAVPTGDDGTRVKPVGGFKSGGEPCEEEKVQHNKEAVTKNYQDNYDKMKRLIDKARERQGILGG
jgi:hypothetical protein